MALFRNISGVGAVNAEEIFMDDTNAAMSPDEGGGGGGGQVDTGGTYYQVPAVDQPVYDPTIAVGPVTEYPADPIVRRTDMVPAPAAPTNILPVNVATPEGNSKKVDTFNALILAGMAVLQVMGSGKKNNNTEALLYAGGVALLSYRLSKIKPTQPVTE